MPILRKMFGYGSSESEQIQRKLDTEEARSQKEIERKLKQKEQEDRNTEREADIKAVAQEVQKRTGVSSESAEHFTRKKMKEYESELARKAIAQKVSATLGKVAKAGLKGLQAVAKAQPKKLTTTITKKSPRKRYHQLIQSGLTPMQALQEISQEPREQDRQPEYKKQKPKIYLKSPKPQKPLGTKPTVHISGLFETAPIKTSFSPPSKKHKPPIDPLSF